MEDQLKTKFWQMIDAAQSIFITSHMSPDDDSISSTLSLYSVIKQIHPNKKVRIVYSGERDSRFTSFRYFDQIEFLEDCSDGIGDSDLQIILDAQSWIRASNRPEKFANLVNTICVDHHKSPPDQFTLLISDTSRPCCAEIIFELCSNVEIDKSLAETFLLGVLGDTGNFSYLKPNQTRTLEIAKILIETGQIEIQEFQSRYRYITPEVFEVIRELIGNLRHGSVKGLKNFSYSYVSREFIDNNNVTENDLTSGKSIFISQYIRKIQDHPWGFTVMPKSVGCRLSLRSLPTGENVREIVEKLNIGGGHDLAAGGTITDIADPLEAVKFFIDKL